LGSSGLDIVVRCPSFENSEESEKKSKTHLLLFLPQRPESERQLNDEKKSNRQQRYDSERNILYVNQRFKLLDQE